MRQSGIRKGAAIVLRVFFGLPLFACALFFTCFAAGINEIAAEIEGRQTIGPKNQDPEDRQP